MKKISATFFILCFVIAVRAQGPESFDPFKDRELYFDILNGGAVLIAIYLITSFIQRLINQFYIYRIKNRMLDKGTGESIVREILQPDKKENKNYILQWFFMLVSMGTGLVLVNLVRPFGLHSLAILAFSIAAGFGAYYYFSRERGD